MTTRLKTADDAEVIVVGAGPAGSSCAALLAEQGHDVLLVDQSSFPRDKPCGDGLTRSAVAFIERMGLHELIASSQPIEGLRMVIDDDSIEYREYRLTSRTPHLARCIPRNMLDEALLNAAIDRGARFLEARIVDRVGPDGGLGVQALIGEQRSVLRSRFVIAADGATSRLRRMSGHARLNEELAAYAVRAYYRCEIPAEPIFDTYMPLEFGGMRVAGYGWVFPIDKYTVNIGVGYWRGAGISSPARIREVLDAFVDYLDTHAQSRFGKLEQISKLAGSPLGVMFRRDCCEMDGIVFVGDAARTTDPWSGEGIAYALHGAEKITELIRARVCGHNARQNAGTVLGRRFGRLGQDLSFPLRLAERRLNYSQRSLGGKARHPFLRTLQNAIAAPGKEEPSLLRTPVGAVLDQDLDSCDRLQQVNDMLLDELETGFPFAGEILYSQMRAGVGPIGAALVILCASGSDHEEALLAAASALELVSASAAPIRETVNRPVSGGARINNALCVLICDFALSRGAHQAVRAGAWLTRELSVVMKEIYQAQFLESQQLFDPCRTVDDYIRIARARMSAPLALAGRFAALTAGHPPDVIAAFGMFGWQLGLGAQVCEDLENLLDGDESIGRAPGTDLCMGAYALPVIYAAETDEELRESLRCAVDHEEVQDVTDSVIATSAPARTLELVTESVQDAERTLDGLDGCAPDGLRELATLVLERTRALIEPVVART
jgi:geranylgeranyl reductase family protein